MITFKLVRKIGKMLRGGAGRREIFLGALCGVLIGFNPVAGLTLVLAILITLLLNANVGFTLLGVALGKVLSLLLAPVTFHTGFFLIHRVGLEGLFTTLNNAPVTALMNLDVYALIGSLPFALLIGTAFGLFMASLITKIREQMVRAGESDKVGKIADNKIARLLMWMVFGKKKVSTADVLAKESPLLRKSGLILVGSVLIIGLLLQFFLLDAALKRGLERAISTETGAEVNIERANLSPAEGKLEIEGLQIADPDKLTHNMVQIETLSLDVSVSDLLRRTYAIDQLTGSMLQRDVPRDTPAKRLVKEEAEEESAEELDATEEGKPLDAYLTQANKWKTIGEKAYNYLKERERKSTAATSGEKAPPSKERAVARAHDVGYLKASADLRTTRPKWVVHSLRIEQVQLGEGQPEQLIEASELSSHPELNGEATHLAMTPTGSTEPTVELTLRFDDPAAEHKLALNLKDLSIADAIKTGDQLTIEEGRADLVLDGSFSADTLNAPFTVRVYDLKTDNQTLNSLKQIELPGTLYGSLLSPRIKVDLSDNLKDAVVDAAKERAKEEAQKAAEEEVNKALESEEAQELKDKAKGTLKGLF